MPRDVTFIWFVFLYHQKKFVFFSFATSIEENTVSIHQIFSEKSCNTLSILHWCAKTHYCNADNTDIKASITIIHYIPLS